MATDQVKLPSPAKFNVINKSRAVLLQIDLLIFSIRVQAVHATIE